MRSIDIMYNVLIINILIYERMSYTRITIAKGKSVGIL